MQNSVDGQNRNEEQVGNFSTEDLNDVDQLLTEVGKLSDENLEAVEQFVTEIAKLSDEELHAMHDPNVIEAQADAWCEQLLTRRSAFSGHSSEGHSSEGHSSDGHSSDGHSSDGHSSDGENVTAIHQMSGSREIPVSSSASLDCGTIEIMSHYILTVFVTSVKMSVKIGPPLLTADWVVSKARNKPMFTSRLYNTVLKRGKNTSSHQKNEKKEEFSCIVGDPPATPPGF